MEQFNSPSLFSFCSLLPAFHHRSHDTYVALDLVSSFKTRVGNRVAYRKMVHDLSLLGV